LFVKSLASPNVARRSESFGEKTLQMLCCLKTKFTFAFFDRGKIVYVDIWATWCGGCLYAIDHTYPDFVQHFDQEQVVFVFMGIFSKQALLKKRINRFAFPALHLLPNQTQ
jgi:thiol-disulfide isomerase/thioredoxin